MFFSATQSTVKSILNDGHFMNNLLILTSPRRILEISKETKLNVKTWPEYELGLQSSNSGFFTH